MQFPHFLKKRFEIMAWNVYSARYTLCILFYVGVNFVLIIIVKTGYMNSPHMKIFTPKTNITFPIKSEIAYEKWKSHKATKFSDICAKNNLSTPLTRRHFLYSSEYGSMYCWIRKVASTSFTKLFSDMKNRKITNNYYREVDVLAPKSLTVLKNLVERGKVFKFLIVRHPFERLVSSYRDRLEDNSKYTAQAWIYAKKIFHLTRPHLLHSNDTTGSSTRQIFYDNKRLRIIPSFSEFVKWLLNEDPSKDDPHWAPYFRHCSLCEIDYDLILHLQNNAIPKIDFLFSKLGLVAERSIDLQILETSIGGKTDSTRTCQYLKSLNRDEIIKLYAKYKIDFKMFGYNFKNYLKCSSDAK